MCHMIGGIYTLFFSDFCLGQSARHHQRLRRHQQGRHRCNGWVAGRGAPPCSQTAHAESDATWTQLATMSTPFTPTGSRKSHLILSHKQYSKVLTNVSGTSTRLTSRNRSLELLRASDARDAAVSATIWTRKMKMNIRTELIRLIIPPQVRGVFPFLCRSIRVQSNAPTLNRLPLQGNRRLLRKHPSSGHP